MKKAVYITHTEISEKLSEAFQGTFTALERTEFDSAPFRICGVNTDKAEDFLRKYSGDIRPANCFYENGTVLCNGLVMGSFLSDAIGTPENYGGALLADTNDCDGYMLVFLKQNIA